MVQEIKITINTFLIYRYFHFLNHYIVVMVLFGFLINKIPDGDNPMTSNGKSRDESILCFYVTGLLFYLYLGGVVL